MARGAGLLHRVRSKSRNLTPRANNFSPVFDRKSLGHRNYLSFGIVRFNIRESFAEADWTFEFRFTGHISNMRRSFGLTGWARDQPISRYPRRVPGFEGLTTNSTLEAVMFARSRHAFSAAIDRSAFAGSMARF